MTDSLILWCCVTAGRLSVSIPPTQLERCKNKTLGTVNPARKSIFLHPFPHIIQTKLTDLFAKLCLHYLGNDVWKNRSEKNDYFIEVIISSFLQGEQEVTMG